MKSGRKRTAKVQKTRRGKRGAAARHATRYDPSLADHGPDPQSPARGMDRALREKARANERQLAIEALCRAAGVPERIPELLVTTLTVHDVARELLAAQHHDLVVLRAQAGADRAAQILDLCAAARQAPRAERLAADVALSAHQVALMLLAELAHRASNVAPAAPIPAEHPYRELASLLHRASQQLARHTHVPSLYTVRVVDGAVAHLELHLERSQNQESPA